MGGWVNLPSFPDKEDPPGPDAAVLPCLVEHDVLRCDQVVCLGPSRGQTDLRGSHINTPRREAVVRKEQMRLTGQRISALPHGWRCSPGNQQKYQDFPTDAMIPL